MANSYLDITKDNLSHFSEDIFTKVKNKGYLTSVDFNDVEPLEVKTYQNIIATANTQAAATFYCLQIFPEDLYKPCRIKIRVRASINDSMTISTKKQYYQEHVIELLSMGGTFTRYVTDNAIYSTSYRPIYYNTVYKATAAGISAGYPHYFGPSLYNSSSPTAATHKRDFEIAVLEIEGGTYAFLDEPILAAAFYDTSYYSSVTNYNATTNGRIGTSMSTSNTYDRTYINSFAPLAGATMYGTQLVLSADGITYYSITKDRSSGTSHVLNQVPFDPTFLYYYTSSTIVGANARGAVSTLYTNIPLDFRYSSNAGSTLTAHKPVYLIATKNEETGLYTLVSGVWWTQEPTNVEGYYYIYLGLSYNNTSIYLEAKHPIYTFQNGILKLAPSSKGLDIELAAVATSGNYSDLNGAPTIPTKTSQLINDSNYLTTHQDISGKQDSALIVNVVSFSLEMMEGTTDIHASIGVAAFKNGQTILLNIGNAYYIKMFSEGEDVLQGKAFMNGTEINITWHGTTIRGASVFIPTGTSDLINDSGFLTSHQDISGKADISALQELQAQLASYSPYIDGETLYFTNNMEEDIINGSY